MHASSPAKIGLLQGMSDACTAGKLHAASLYFSTLTAAPHDAHLHAGTHTAEVTDTTCSQPTMRPCMRCCYDSRLHTGKPACCPRCCTHGNCQGTSSTRKCGLRHTAQHTTNSTVKACHGHPAHTHTHHQNSFIYLSAAVSSECWGLSGTERHLPAHCTTAPGQELNNQCLKAGRQEQTGPVNTHAQHAHTTHTIQTHAHTPVSKMMQ